MRNLFLLVVLFWVTPPVSTYPTGADLSACVTMEPNHGGNTATGDAPYTFTISQTDGSTATEYTIGEVLTSEYSYILSCSNQHILLEGFERNSSRALYSLECIFSWLLVV